MSNKIMMAGFTVPKDRKRLIDRKDVTKPDGTIDYLRLVKKVDELGIRLQRERNVMQRI